MNERKVYIYTLVEQGSEDVRYVGQTVDPESRLKGHLNTSSMADGNAKKEWIDEVLTRGSSIEMIIVDECTIQTAKDTEQMWIDRYIDSGCALTNTASALTSNAGSGRSAGKQPKSYRFSHQVRDALDYLGALTGINETAIIELAIFNEALRLGYRPSVYVNGAANPVDFETN